METRMRSVTRGALAFALVACPAALSAATTRSTAPLGGASPFAGSIRGRVVDRETDQPIPAVQLLVVGTRFGASTDNSGNFVIHGVPAGTVTLRVTRIGYQATSV